MIRPKNRQREKSDRGFNRFIILFFFLFLFRPISVLAQVPGGEEISPPSGEVWEVYCYGNGDTMAAVFEGLALILQGGTISALVKLAVFAGLVVMLGYMAFGLLTQGPYRVMLTPLQGVALAAITFFMFTARADVAIFDRHKPFEGTTVVQNVPFFAAFPASVFSRLGDKLVEKFEEAFMPLLNTGEEFTVRKHGFGFGPSLLDTVSHSVPMDANFLNNLAFYIDRCVRFEMESLYGKKRNWNEVFKGQSLDDLLKSYNRAIEITITEPACPDLSDVTVPCPTLYEECIKPVLLGQQSSVMNDLKEEIARAKKIDRPTLDGIINELTGTVLGYTSVSASEFWAAVVANNIFADTFFESPAGSLGYANALYQANTTWETAGKFLKNLLPEIRSIFEILLYSFSVFLPLIFFTFRLKALLTYFSTALWLQLWGVAYAVGNFIAIDRLMKLKESIADCGVGIYCLAAIKNQTAYSLASSYLPITLGIILLAGLIYGGEYAFLKASSTVTGEVTARGMEGAGQAADFQKTGSLTGTYQRAAQEGMTGIGEYASREAFMRPVYYWSKLEGDWGLEMKSPGYSTFDAGTWQMRIGQDKSGESTGEAVLNLPTGTRISGTYDPYSGKVKELIAVKSPIYQVKRTTQFSDEWVRRQVESDSEVRQLDEVRKKEWKEAENAAAKSLYEMHESLKDEHGQVDTNAYARNIATAFNLEERKARELAERAEKAIQQGHVSRGDKYVGLDFSGSGSARVSLPGEAITGLKAAISGSLGGKLGYQHHWINETGKTSQTSTSTGKTTSTITSTEDSITERSGISTENLEQRFREIGLSEKNARETAKEIGEAWAAEKAYKETFSKKFELAKDYATKLALSEEFQTDVTRSVLWEASRKFWTDYGLTWIAIKKADEYLSSGGAESIREEMLKKEAEKRMGEKLGEFLKEHPVSANVDKALTEGEGIKAEVKARRGESETPKEAQGFQEKYEKRKEEMEQAQKEREAEIQAEREKVEEQFRERKEEGEKITESPKNPHEPKKFW